MKRRVALLLAIMMALSLFPATVSASTPNFITNRPVVSSNTLFFEAGLVPALPGNTQNAHLFQSYPYWFVDGPDLIIPLQTAVQAGSQFSLTLSNAEWNFDRHFGNSGHSTFDTRFGSFDTGNRTYTRAAQQGTTPGAFVVGRDLFPPAQGGTQGGHAAIPGTGQIFHEARYTLQVSALDRRVATVTITGAHAAAESVIFRIPLVTFVEDSNREATVAIDPGLISTVTRQTMIFASTADGRTNTTMDGSAIAGYELFDLHRIIINELRAGSIRANETIRLALPDGFYFDNNFGNGPRDVRVGIERGLAWGDGTVGHGVFFNSRTDLGGNRFFVEYGAGRRADDRLNWWQWDFELEDPSTLLIYIGDIQHSDQLRGSIFIDNLRILAEHDARLPFDINMTIDSRLESITRQTILVARRLAHNVTLTATDPTILISGRYIGPRWDSMDVDDNTHQTARVTLTEVVPHSWWGARTTVLTLPQTDNDSVRGAKFRMVEVYDSENIHPAPENLNVRSALYSSPLNHQSAANQPIPNLSGIYLNDGERHGSIMVDEHRILITNLRMANDVNANQTGTQTRRRAEIVLDLWVSIEYGFGAQSRDLILRICHEDTTSIPGINADNAPYVVIAHVYDPITVETTVSDLRIGYQHQPTANIVIHEVGPGYLLRNKTVRVSITDLVVSDMFFHPDSNIEVTYGDLRIRNIRNRGVGGFTSQSDSWLPLDGSAGQILFDIDRESTVASTITLSNLGVRLDRTVPVTNRQSYQALVWGTAIAENYGTWDGVRHWRSAFNTPGEFVPYINVVTAAPGGILTQEVRVPIGESHYYVNGVRHPMDAVAYISPASNSTMVPVRFVANAFGLTNDQIVWDPEDRTATIFAPNRTVQFQYGSSTMIVDGVAITMTSPDGLPVQAEIVEIDGIGRMYLPFRALGNAFGVPVDWDAETRTAIYNQGANVNAPAAAAHSE